MIDLVRGLKTLRVLYVNFADFGELDFYTVDYVRMLLDACSSTVKVHSSVKGEPNSSFVDFVRVVGTRLHKLDVTGQFDSLPRDVLPGLRNIEELSFNLFVMDPPVEYMSTMESVFAEPLPNLRKLTLLGVNTSKILSVIALAASNLREFECNFLSMSGVDDEEVDVSGSDITEFLQANEHLRSIVLHYFGIESSVIDGIIDFIPRLKVCRYLKVVNIGLMPRRFRDNYKIRLLSRRMRTEISNACVSLRTKPLSLIVNGTPFLPS